MKKVIISVWLMLLSGTAQAEWVEYGTTDRGSFYYDPDRVTQSSDGKIGVWIKKVSSPENIIARRSKRNLPIKGYENYSHSFDKDIYSCSDRTAAISSMTDYANHGGILNSFNVKKADLEFENVIPESMGEYLMNLVCKKK